MEDYLVAKIVSIFILGGFALFLGLAPIQLKQYFDKKNNNLSSKEKEVSKFQLVLTALNCFGAGVILTTCFTHMLPEVDHALLDLVDKGLMSDGG